MARPGKGQKGYKQANKKWHATMLEKFNGDEEKMREFFRSIGRKGGINGRGEGYKGGFASDNIGEDGMTGPQRARLAGARGGHISSRAGVKNGQRKAKA